MLNEKPILYYTINKFENCPPIDEIIVVTSLDDLALCEAVIFKDNTFKKSIRIVVGGNERQESVFNGLKNTNPKTEIVVIHDGVRPFVKIRDIEKTIENADKNKACVLGVMVKDTVKICSKNIVLETPDRNNLWFAQTPQTFNYSLILNAHIHAVKENFSATDDSMLLERLGINVFMLEGSYDNIKITTPEDLFLAEYLIKNDN